MKMETTKIVSSMQL